MKTCQKCNASVADGAEICSCGQWFRVAPVESEDAPQSKPVKRRGWLVANVVAGIMSLMTFSSSNIPTVLSKSYGPAVALAGFAASFYLAYLVANQVTTRLRPHPNGSTLMAAGITFAFFAVGMAALMAVQAQA